MIKIGLVGYRGRMGQLIAENIRNNVDCSLSSVYQRKPDEIQLNEICVTDLWQEFLMQCDVVIDFSNQQASQQLLNELQKTPKPLVMGTTGLKQEDFYLMQSLAKDMPIVYATNTSRGVVLLNEIVFFVAQKLKDADIEIVELHHRHKKDSPSGTAMTLAQECAKAREKDFQEVCITERNGTIGARKQEEIGVMSLRGGDVVGRHTVGFYCDGEYLEFTHNATDRKTFAIGAIEAVKWVISQVNGLYNMKDVLGV